MLASRPDDIDIRTLIAVIAKQRGDVAGAVEQYTWLMRHTADSVQMRYNRAEALFEGGAYQQAREDIDTLLAVQPDHPLVRQLSAKVEEKLRSVP